MNGRVTWRAAAPILAIGAAISTLAVLHVVVDDDPLLPELLDAGILLVFAVTVLTVGVRVVTDGVDWQSGRRILQFTVGTSLVVGGLSAVYVISLVSSDEPPADIWFVLSIGFSLGAGAGALIGYYLDQYERSLQHEAELSRRLTVLQRVLRHNIRNEVTIIEGVSTDLAERIDDPEAVKSLETITRHIGQIYRVAEKSQDLANVWQSDETVELDVIPALMDSIDAVAASHPTVSVTHTMPDSVRIEAHPRIGMAFEEVLDNAARHNETVSVDVDVCVTGDSATFRFVDSGGGIPAAEIEPLLRGHERPLEHTTGIGLWFVYWLVNHSNGSLSFSESAGGGAVVEITLPSVA